MKNLLLIFFLLVASRVVFGQRLLSGPKDLAVIVEVLSRNNQRGNGHSKQRTGIALNAKVVLQNKTNKAREIAMMTCGWNESWVSKGRYSFDGCDACDSNFPRTINIPAGQSIVFYGTLYPGSGNMIAKTPRTPIGNRLGFMDFAYRDFDDLPSTTVVVYWSNEFTGKLASNAHQPSSGSRCDYYLSKTGK